MADTVGELEFPIHGFLESRRGPIVEVALSNDPLGAPRTYLLVPEGAGELPAGIYSTGVKSGDDVDEDGNWLLSVSLERERPEHPVQHDPVLVEDDRYDPRDYSISSTIDAFLPQEPPQEREGGQPINPYGLWALDEQGRAFLVESDLDAETGGLVIEAASRYGASLHPWYYLGVPTDGRHLTEEDFAADDALVELTVTELVEGEAVQGDAPQTWTIGTRRAIEAAAPHPLPDFDPEVWMRWLTPVDGGDPVAFGGFTFPGDRMIELQPVMPAEPAWAVGRVVTIPRERRDQEYEDAREVTVYAKPFKELRSSVTKIAKRPPTPVGRFRLEAEGTMPPGWSLLG